MMSTATTAANAGCGAVIERRALISGILAPWQHKKRLGSFPGLPFRMFIRRVL